MSTRNDIRKSILAKRQALSVEEHTSLSHTICEQLLTLESYVQAKNIAFYVANKGEVNPPHPQPLRDSSPQRGNVKNEGCKIYLPILDPERPNHLLFQAYEQNDELTPNQYNILEPTLNPEKLIDPIMLDCVLVPLVAFDPNCNRLGMGVGYYDRSFSFLQESQRPHKPLLIGLAFELQKVTDCEPKEWDIPLDYVVTEANIYRYRKLGYNTTI